MAHNDIRIHEVTFCGRVMKWAEALFKSQPESPFKRVEIEESKGIKRKRSDLRIYDHAKKLLLAGEVKLPGTPDGRNPYDGRLVEDAFLKASNAGAQFFFTWNVNKLVLFDSSLWQKPLYERRVKEYDLGLNLQEPADVDRAEVEEDIRAFLAAFFIGFAQIVLGEREDWGMAPDELFVRARSNVTSHGRSNSRQSSWHGRLQMIQDLISSYSDGWREIKAGRLFALTLPCGGCC